MITPFDWQEGIGNRASYIEGKLAQGAPVLAVSLPEGILAFTYRRLTRKVYELYDRLLFAGIGQQSDVEALRVAGLEFCSREGYSRSEKDVTVGRVATAMSGPLKRAFGDYAMSPLVARLLLAEVGETPEKDAYFTLDYDGDYAPARMQAALAGTLEGGEVLEGRLKDLPRGSVDEAVAALMTIYRDGLAEDGDPDERMKGLKPEGVLLSRDPSRENRFRLLYPEEF